MDLNYELVTDKEHAVIPKWLKYYANFALLNSKRSTNVTVAKFLKKLKRNESDGIRLIAFLMSYTAKAKIPLDSLFLFKKVSRG